MTQKETSDDDRPNSLDDELLLSCICHGYHYIEFWYDDQDKILTVTHVERPASLRMRLEAILNILRGKTLYDGDILLKTDDYDKLIRYLERARENCIQR